MTDTVSDGGQGGGQSGGESGATATTREWMAGLPDDLKADATLSRYETPEALARGHLEARRALSTRVAVPGADADEATRNAYYTAIGRPDTAEGYAFDVADNDQARASAGEFGKFAFGLGMPKDMAEAVVKFDNDRQAAVLKSYQDTSRAEFEQWRADKPDADARITAMSGLLNRFGIEDVDAAQIEARLGTRRMFDLFDKMAAATGEHQRQDGERQAQTGAATAEDAEKAMSDRMKDPTFRADVRTNKPEAVAEYKALLKARTDAAMAKKGA
jgi:hypothetical protein